VIGAVLIRLTPVLVRLLHSAAGQLRRRDRAAGLASVLTKAGDGLSWVARRQGRGPSVNG